MKELDLGLSKGLLNSVSGVLKDSSKAKAEIAKTANEQLSSHYTKMAARPLSAEEAKVTTYASKAPERRVNDAISAVYSKSVAESAAKAKAEAEAIQRAYAARGAAKPITEQKETDPTHPETLKKRKEKMQADVSDETILDGETIDEKAHTVPKTEKEKKLAAIAEPKDKITHADVMVGRGLRKEGFAEMDAWLKKRKAEEGTGKFEKKKISTGTVYTKKPEKEQKVDEAMQKSDVPAYLRKQKGEKPLTVADVKGPRPDSISSKEGLAKLRNEEVLDEKIILDKDGNKIGGGSVMDTIKDKDKLKFKPSVNKPDTMTKEEVELEEATHVFSGFTGFMKKHASKLRDAGLKVKKIIHDEDSGTTEYHVSGPRTAAKAAGKEYQKADKGQNYGGHFTEEVEQIDELKAKTLASYINKAKHSVASDAYAFGAKADTQGTANRFANRLVGINKATKSLVKKIKEETDTPGNSTHQCAIHVKHAKLGEGKTLFSQHAAPDAEGNIAWYDVMFAEGIEKKVPTTDLEILVSESHMNHKKKKAM